MSFFDTYLFDDPTPILLISAAVAVVMLVRWIYRRERWAIYTLAGAVVVMGTVALCDHWVETDREQMVACCDELVVEYTGGGPLTLLEATLADTYHGYGVTKDLVLMVARKERKKQVIEKVKITRLEVNIQGKHAAMDITTVIHMKQGIHALAWKVFWVKLGDTWKIEEARQPSRAVPGFTG
jgi:hypothetical protein